MHSNLFFALALAASTASAHPGSPSAAAIVTGTPFDMRASPTPIPASGIAARQDWASPPAAPAWSAPPAPAWYQPAVPTPAVPTVVVTATATATASATPSPSPNYTWEETHDDSKNTHKHEIIAAVIVGIFVGLPIVVCVAGVMYRRCRKGGRVKNKGLKVPDVEDGMAQFRIGDNVDVRYPQPPPLAHATRGPDGRFSNVPL